MYLDYFNFTQQPFSITADSEFFYAGCSRAKLLEKILNAAIDGEGIIKIVGKIGSGKTILCKTLEQRLPKSIISTYIINPKLTPEQLYSVILTQFNITLPKTADSTQYRQLLEHHLIAIHVSGRQALLILDDAHRIPLETLNELRFLNNLETGSHKLIQIIIAGQPQLDKQLADKNLCLLKERISCNLTIPNFSLKDTEEYILTRLTKSGYISARLFSPAAIALIHRAANGSLRRINVVAHNALIVAYRDDCESVERFHAQRAVIASEFLTPSKAWNKNHLAAACLLGVICFGGSYINSTGYKIESLLWHVADSMRDNHTSSLIKPPVTVTVEAKTETSPHSAQQKGEKSALTEKNLPAGAKSTTDKHQYQNQDMLVAKSETVYLATPKPKKVITSDSITDNNQNMAITNIEQAKSEKVYENNKDKVKITDLNSMHNDNNTAIGNTMPMSTTESTTNTIAISIDNEEYPEYGVQIGSYTDLQQANNRLELLSKKGYTPFVHTTTNNNGVPVTKVLLGRFKGFSKAKEAAAKFKAKVGQDTFIFAIADHTT